MSVQPATVEQCQASPWWASRKVKWLSQKSWNCCCCSGTLLQTAAPAPCTAPRAEQLTAACAAGHLQHRGETAQKFWNGHANKSHWKLHSPRWLRGNNCRLLILHQKNLIQQFKLLLWLCPVISLHILHSYFKILTSEQLWLFSGRSRTFNCGCSSGRGSRVSHTAFLSVCPSAASHHGTGSPLSGATLQRGNPGVST